MKIRLSTTTMPMLQSNSRAINDFQPFCSSSSTCAKLKDCLIFALFFEIVDILPAGGDAFEPEAFSSGSSAACGSTESMLALVSSGADETAACTSVGGA
eukprot:CAMPEP_0197700206 /NCGR_PEP_ID=MMETSP1338-20131121/121688_1 /TAXON_ID=43686 ORGANISM="Pelagodinium beii, Strain RCC1491" /NCGR_SAMPLE_ID=MMETSP1338 /ASSEMBLY_ACC=CAM_ASM_000754 /LENGTH=98 /DNA_ID=CAMNT_0043283787 /DNA_START=192 /DNA_END=488 /DNA_ORIENTATION=+